MAKECRDVIDSIKVLMDRRLDRRSIDELYNAREYLIRVARFLRCLEEICPENAILTQLRPLFIEAHEEFLKIPSNIKDRRILMKLFKPRPEEMIREVLKIILPHNIGSQLRALKASRSSDRITMDMVYSVMVLFDCVAYNYHISSDHREQLAYARVFLALIAKRCIEHESMKDLFTHVENVAYDVTHLCFTAFDDNFDSRLSELLENFSPFRAESRRIYLRVLKGLKSTRSEASLNLEDMLSFVHFLRDDLKHLIYHDDNLKDALNSVSQGLPYLYSFLQIMRNDCFLVSVPSHMEALAIELAFLIYSLYDEETDMHVQLKLAFYCIRLQVGRPHYVEETDMPLQLELAFNHVRLEVGLAEILKRAKAPLKNLINYVIEELIFLGNFLVEQWKEVAQLTDFLTLIQSVSSQAYSGIDSHCRDEHLAGEINCLHFQFLLKFNFMKAVIRQKSLIPISASSSLEHSTINLLDFLPINFEVIDSYICMLTSSPDGPSMDEVLMGFHEYILHNLLSKCETNMTFIVVDDVKKFHHGLLLLATYFLIEAYEDAEDCNRTRNFDLVFQFLFEAFKLSKYKGRLMDLLNHRGTLEAEILDLIKRGHEELILLVAFLMDVLRQGRELNKFNDLLVCAAVTAQRLAQVSGSGFEDFIDVCSTEKLKPLLYDYMQRIESVKVEARKVCFLLQDASPCNMTDGEDLIKFLLSHQEWPLKYDACPFSIPKNQIPVIKDKLVYLGSFLADIVQYRYMHQELKDLMGCARDRKYVCLFPVKGCRPAWYDILYLSDVKQLLKFVEDNVKLICLKSPDLSVHRFPKTNGLGFLDCFLGNLEELLHSKLQSVIDLKQQIESVKEGLLCLRSSIDPLAESYDENDETCGLVTSVTEMAYKAEYVIDSCLTYSHPPWYKVLWISEVFVNIKRVNEVVSDAFGGEKIDMAMHKVARTSMNVAASSSSSSPRENEETEGFEEAMDIIKKQLLGGSSQLDVISIVGMPGIGKTTLAEKIYSDLIATSDFDVHAKCRVTQAYSWKELLLTILNDVIGPADRANKEDGELANELRQSLLTKRFLILVDDVWDTAVWDYFCMCFQGSQNRSRIILTTRLSDIANYAKCKSNPHHLRLFIDDESWRLLQELVFQGYSCPPGLVDVGIRIAKSCGGLPLFIVLVAGVLKKKEMNIDMWKKVEESIGSQNIGSLEESLSLIGFSYKNLPHHLKPCFLYFGGFLMGKDILVSKLARLWQVEGFLQANKQRGTECETQDLLEDLISRNLVMAEEKRPNGKVKSCRIHDLLHSFCLEKSRQENFLNQIARFREEDMLPEKPKDYRLFIHSYQDVIDLWRPCRSNSRSLYLKVTDPENLLLPHDISFIFDSFRLVKVMDLELFNIGTFPSEVQSLVFLRYLAVQIDANSIPSFIAKLQNLETFVVRGSGGVVMLPCVLLKMVRLRHILVKPRASFSLHENTSEVLDNTQLVNLEAFSTPCLTFGEDAETILRKMPNLRKLSSVFSGKFGNSEKGNERCVLFPRLEFLSHLVSLKLVSNRYPAKLPHEFNFPSKLRELTLSKFCLPWSEILIIGELPNLEILRLLSRAFEGNHWEVNDSEFPELKYLKLDNINISLWSISDDAFPKLERLVLTKCSRLEEVPDHFGEPTSLKSIEVNWCGRRVAKSAVEIQRMHHEDFADDAFTVSIQPPESRLD